MKASNRKTVHEKYNGRCAYCGLEITQQQMHVDHIHPRCNGGTNAIENLNPSCRSCNNYKGSYSIEHFREALHKLLNTKREYLFKSAVKHHLHDNFLGVSEWNNKFYFEQEL